MSKKCLFFGLFLILAYSFCINLPFLDLREFQGEGARRAIIALEMLQTKDFAVPHIEGQVYLLKPPLYNWILAVFFKIFNDNSEFIARLSSVFFVTITAIFISLLFRKIFAIKDLKFIIPGLIFLSFPEILDKANRAEIECSYVFFITVSTFAWFYLHEIRKSYLTAWIIAYLFLSLATLDKTFQALSYFYPSVFCYLLIRKKIQKIFNYQHFIGLLAYILPFSIWLWALSKEISVNQVFHAWMLEYLWKKNAHNNYGFWGHLISFPLSFIRGYLPWIIFLPFARSHKIIQKLDRHQKNLLVFSTCFLISVFSLYWIIPGARLRYILPCATPLAFLIATPIYFYLSGLEIPALILKFWRAIFYLLSTSLFISLAILSRLKTEYSLISLPIAATLSGISIIYLIKEKKRHINNSQRIIVYFISILLIKSLYASIYFPYKDKKLRHYFFAASRIKQIIPAGSILCDASDRTPWIAYYLKYRWHYIKDIYLHRSLTNLEKCDYIFSIKEIKYRNLTLIATIKARHYKLRLYKVKKK